MSLRWRFPKADGGQIRGCNSGDTELFRKYPYQLFGREILQNSIDVGVSDEEPVRVVFDEFEIDTKDIPGYEDYLKQVELCIKYFEFSQDNKKYCEDIKTFLLKPKTKILRISDFNTSGLRGIERTSLDNNNFLAITKGTGISIKPGVVSAGSKGVGKNAAINLSNIRMVFYATKTIDGYEGSLGVSELITGYISEDEANKKGAYTQGSGYFEDSNNEINIIDKVIKFKSDYKDRDENTGTDIYIVGFDGEEGWEREVINSALDSFMATFVYRKLEIEINGTLITRDTLENIVSSNLIYDKNKANIISQYRLLTGVSGVHTYDIDTEYGTLDLMILPYGKSEEHLATHCCTMIRHPLMKIKNFDLGKNIQASALCIIRDDTLGKQLRSIENAQHNDWETKRFKDVSVRKEFNAILNYICDEINRYVIECLQLGSDSPLDPYGAGDYLPEDTNGGNGTNDAEQKHQTEKTIISKKKENKTKIKPGIQESDNDSDEGLQPDIGGVDDSEDGNVLHPTGHNEHQGNTSHPGEDQGKEKEGDSEIFKKASLKVVKYNVVCINKEEGLYKVVFIPLEDKNDCYFRICLLDDTNGKYDLPISSVFYAGDNLEFKENLGYGPFAVKTNLKAELRVKINTKKNFGSGVTILC